MIIASGLWIVNRAFCGAARAAWRNVWFASTSLSFSPHLKSSLRGRPAGLNRDSPKKRLLD